MKWSFESAGVIGFCLVGLTILFLFGVLTINNESDYYNLKETTEAAMLESVDIAYYRANGELKIAQEKFVENFTKRFADTVGFGTSGYKIVFEDIVERPAKVSIVVTSQTGDYRILSDARRYNIVNKIDSVLEYSPRSPSSQTLGGKRSGEGTAKKWVPKTMTLTYTSMPYTGAWAHSMDKNIPLHIQNYMPEELNECVRSDIRNVQYLKVANVRMMSYAEQTRHWERYEESFIYEGGHGNLKFWQAANSIDIDTNMIKFFLNTSASGNETADSEAVKNMSIDSIQEYNGENDYIYDCSNTSNPIKDVWVAWKARSYDCSGDGMQPKGENTDGETIYSRCLLPITYDLVFTYEQYE